MPFEDESQGTGQNRLILTKNQEIHVYRLVPEPFLDPRLFKMMVVGTQGALHAVARVGSWEL